MQVSVVIPAYNEERDLGDCLESLADQIRRADEIIVVDNGSEDATAEIARQHGARVLSHPRPPSYMLEIGGVRQVGTEAATGDIVVATDADCLFPEDYLARIETHFNENPRLVLIGGPVRNRAENDWFGDFLVGTLNFQRCYSAGWGIPHFLLANAAFRRAAFLKTEGYKGFGAFGIGKEYVISFRLSRLGEWLWDDDLIVYTDVPMAWRVMSVMPLSFAPLAAWGGIALLQGMW